MRTHLLALTWDAIPTAVKIMTFSAGLAAWIYSRLPFRRLRRSAAHIWLGLWEAWDADDRPQRITVAIFNRSRHEIRNVHLLWEHKGRPEREHIPVAALIPPREMTPITPVLPAAPSGPVELVFEDWQGNTWVRRKHSALRTREYRWHDDQNEPQHLTPLRWIRDTLYFDVDRLVSATILRPHATHNGLFQVGVPVHVYVSARQQPRELPPRS